MKITIARLLAFVAIVEGIVAIPVKVADGSILGIHGSGFLRAASVTVLLAIFFLLDDMRDRHQKSQGA